jgi:hypothetical protein
MENGLKKLLVPCPFDFIGEPMLELLNQNEYCTYAYLNNLTKCKAVAAVSTAYSAHHSQDAGTCPVEVFSPLFTKN